MVLKCNAAILPLLCAADGMGYITDTELRIVMCTLGDKLTPEEMNELLTEVECDAEGNVNYEEFCKKLAPEKPPPIK